jgi:alpha-beta hydrolase superfamily lysophospholipase
MSATQERSGGWWTTALMALVLGTGVGYVIATYLASRWLTRSKKRRPQETPAEHGLDYDTLTCVTADGLRLTGWLVEAPSPRGTVAFFHGLRCTRDLMLERMAIFARAGYRCVAFDHRAHGESQGRLTSFGYHEGRDVAAVLDLVKRHWPEQPRVVVGISMGAAAICFAAEWARGADAVILESMYHDILSAFTTRISAGFPRWFGWLLTSIIRVTEWRLGVRLADLTPADHIGRLAPAPVLLVTGTEDSHATPDDARRLYERCRGPRELMLVSGAGHIDLLEVAGPTYAERVLGFLERCTPSAVAS